MAQEGTRDYIAIPKGRGFVYAYDNHLYNRVKTEGRTKYLKCSTVGCDGSAKIVGDMFCLGVCIQSVFFVNYVTQMTQTSNRQTVMTWWCRPMYCVVNPVASTYNFLAAVNTSRQHFEFILRKLNSTFDNEALWRSGLRVSQLCGGGRYVGCVPVGVGAQRGCVVGISM